MKQLRQLNNYKDMRTVTFNIYFRNGARYYLLKAVAALSPQSMRLHYKNKEGYSSMSQNKAQRRSTQITAATP